MAASATSERERVRTLNDLLRRHRIGGQVVLTSGVLALGLDLLLLIDDAISRFDAFTPDNDPYGEHDFGLVRVQGHVVLFKIDYYDLGRSGHSPDPADPSVTCRVMTLMLADEY
jgi:Protein of unknown function (DUF3768)